MPKPRGLLTRKQKAFADRLIENPKMSATQAVKETYDVANPKTATVMAAQNLAKPSIITYLNEHVDLARTTVVSLTTSDKDDIRLRASQDILDRTLGKPVQRQQIETRAVQININLADPTPPSLAP